VRDIHEGSYAEAWLRYRLSSRAFWILFLSFVPGVAIINRIFRLASNGHGIVIFVVAIAWMIAFAVAGYKKGNFQCPRCGELFFRKFDDRLWRRDWVYNPFARRCLHCALPKWTYR
jgi:hypothetical protein